MRLSLRGEYALRALIDLGLNYNENVVRIQAISKRQSIPQRFLEQILNDLKSGGFVESKRGVAGGYRLARPPEELGLAAVVRHVEGALAPLNSGSKRSSRGRTGPNEASWVIGNLMEEVRGAIVKTLEQVTVADLCERARRLSSERGVSLDYDI